MKSPSEDVSATLNESTAVRLAYHEHTKVGEVVTAAGNAALVLFP